VINWHELKDYGIGTLATCATLHSILPPWDWNPSLDWLSDFPKVQNAARRSIAFVFRNRYYKLAIYIIGFAGAHARSTIWRKSISMPVQFDKMQQDAGQS
jgi:hypothetical protein